jgi:hypothetical protein
MSPVYFVLFQFIFMFKATREPVNNNAGVDTAVIYTKNVQLYV